MFVWALSQGSWGPETGQLHAQGSSRAWRNNIFCAAGVASHQLEQWLFLCPPPSNDAGLMPCSTPFSYTTGSAILRHPRFFVFLTVVHLMFDTFATSDEKNCLCTALTLIIDNRLGVLGAYRNPGLNNIRASPQGMQHQCSLSQSSPYPQWPRGHFSFYNRLCLSIYWDYQPGCQVRSRWDISRISATLCKEVFRLPSTQNPTICCQQLTVYLSGRLGASRNWDQLMREKPQTLFKNSRRGQVRVLGEEAQSHSLS